MDLSHLKWDRQGDQGTHKVLLSPNLDPPILLCMSGKWVLGK